MGYSVVMGGGRGKIVKVESIGSLVVPETHNKR